MRTSKRTALGSAVAAMALAAGVAPASAAVASPVVSATPPTPAAPAAPAAPVQPDAPLPLTAPASAAAGTGVITTVAGGVGGPAKATTVSLNSGGTFRSYACGVGYGNGQVQIADGYSVRSVNPATDQLTTPVGNGAEAILGDGGPATVATVTDACSTAVDQHGNLVIAPFTIGRIQVMAHTTGTFYGQAMTAGDIYTVAGTGLAEFNGDHRLALSADIAYPHSVAVDSHGNLLIADAGNGRIRVVAVVTGTFYGQQMIAGDIYTVAGNGKFTGVGNGGPATRASLGFPQAVTLDAAGNVVIDNTEDCEIQVVAEHTGTFYGQKMTTGDIYAVAGNGTEGYSGDGGPALKAQLDQSKGMALDKNGNIVIADTGNSRVRVAAEHTGTFYGQRMTTGHIYSVAGTGTAGHTGIGGPGTAAEIDKPLGVSLDGNGNLLLADTGWVEAVPARSGTYYGQQMTAGHIYDIAGRGLGQTSGEGGPATAAEFINPQTVSFDGAGDLLTSVANSTVQMVPATSGSYFGQAMAAGHIYAVAGDGHPGFSGDGGPAARARLFDPEGLAFDPAGNLVIVDAANNRIRVVAAHAGTFYGQQMTTGHIYTVAGTGTCGLSGVGGPATAAQLCLPVGLAMDAVGNLVFTDWDESDSRVQVVAAKTGTFYGQKMTAGDIYAVAGTGPCGFSGDGGRATSATFCGPRSVAVDGDGNLVIADEANGRIRVVADSTGRFYGQKMTAGDIYTVAGNGGDSGTGDGGPATSAELNQPGAVAVNTAGDVAIADAVNNRVRIVRS
jgi:hypothetical protein